MKLSTSTSKLAMICHLMKNKSHFTKAIWNVSVYFEQLKCPKSTVTSINIIVLIVENEYIQYLDHITTMTTKFCCV